VQHDHSPKSKEETSMKVVDLPNNKPTNMSYFPIRIKKSEDTQETKKSVPTIGLEELESLMTEFYKNLDLATMTPQIINLAQKTKNKDFLNVFFKTFHDAKIETVQKRIPIIRILFENKVIDADEFLKCFSFAMSKLYEYDLPNLPGYMAQIYLDYMSIFEGVKLTDIRLPEEVDEDYIADCIYDNCIDFVRRVQELSKSDYLGLTDRLEKDLDLFEKKVKDWKVTCLK